MIVKVVYVIDNTLSKDLYFLRKFYFCVSQKVLICFIYKWKLNTNNLNFHLKKQWKKQEKKQWKSHLNYVLLYLLLYFRVLNKKYAKEELIWIVKYWWFISW